MDNINTCIWSTYCIAGRRHLNAINLVGVVGGCGDAVVYCVCRSNIENIYNEQNAHIFNIGYIRLMLLLY